MKKVVISDIGQLTRLLSSLWVQLCTAAVKKNRPFAVALSGGSTPAPFYQKLSEIQDPDLWRAAQIFQTDERVVPPDHPDNNFRMIRETLTDRAPVLEENLHPVMTGGCAEQAAVRYEAEIINFFNLPYGALPGFDLILLGIGTDGHTASIFPNSDLIQEKKRLVGIAYPSPDKHHRVTLTLPILNNAARIVFLATGKAKAPVLKEVLENESSELPASFVCAKTGPTIYMIDPFAASELSESTVRKYGGGGTASS